MWSSFRAAAWRGRASLEKLGLGLLSKRSDRRSYYVDRQGYRHFKPRGPSAWMPEGGSLSRRTTILAVAAGGAAAVVYYTHIEVVPYTSRKHFVLISPKAEIALGQMTFEKVKHQFKNRILPPYHPAVLRVARIAENTITAATEGISLTGFDREFRLDYSASVPQQKRVGDVSGFRGSNMFSEKDIFSEKESVLDDVWVDETRKDGKLKGRKAYTNHVQNFKWEIVVVESNEVNAACLPGGKIIVFTGLLKAFPYDDEIATVIGHEVAHAIARHSAETLTRTIFIGFVEILLLAIVQVPNAVGTASELLLRLPFSRKMELEADHIGLLIMAAAGYNPKVSPTVYLKIGELQKAPEYFQYISTHPSGQTRAKALIKSSAMKEAIAMYEAKRGGWASSGFLL